MGLPPVTKIEGFSSRPARRIEAYQVDAGRASPTDNLEFSTKPSDEPTVKLRHIERIANGSARDIRAGLTELSMLGKISLPISFAALVTEGRLRDPLSKDRAHGRSPRPTLLHLKEAVSAFTPPTSSGRIVKIVRDGVVISTPPVGKLINSGAEAANEADRATTLQEESTLTSLIRGAKSFGLPHDMIIKILALRIARRVTNNDNTPELLNFLQDGVAKDDNIRALAGRLIESVKQGPVGLVELLCDSVQRATTEGLSIENGFNEFASQYIDALSGVTGQEINEAQCRIHAEAISKLTGHSVVRRAYQRVHFNEMQN